VSDVLAPPVVVDVLIQEASGMGVAGYGIRCHACSHVEQPRRAKDPLGKLAREQGRTYALIRAAEHAQEQHDGFTGWAIGPDVVLPYRR
jgi:hypothetical protein